MDSPVRDSIPHEELQPGIQYDIPFKFIVPLELPVQVCHHKCCSAQLQQEHLNLPPSLGHTSKYFDVTHDMAPKEAQVIYEIAFAIWDTDNSKDGRMKKTQEYNCPIYILPKSREGAPILVPSRSEYYRLTSQKTLTKGLFRSSLGLMRASTAQPPAIQTSTSLLRDNLELTTTLRVDLTFESTHPHIKPPSSIAPKLHLKAMTFLGLEPWEQFPNQTHPSTWDAQKAYRFENITLSSNKMVLDWRSQPKTRKSDREPSCHTVYTASVDILVVLPGNYLYPPTFHSCFISRVYSLSTNLSFHSHDKASGNTRLSMKAPVQILVT
ncbi:hypothetical protein N7478_008931 [Penicillium angulare]|uniref:uncharacterized protein n=1 Tax=Penicillium angulare TaxID=116970 RepID=UPI00253F98FD|nr:uncharacterized protein N7478_008931 [Penicillium angulare]KAJ5273806.1 hypothetical protein N7478_008931 [Penicillium angulare]